MIIYECGNKKKLFFIQKYDLRDKARRKNNFSLKKTNIYFEFLGFYCGASHL